MGVFKTSKNTQALPDEEKVFTTADRNKLFEIIIDGSFRRHESVKSSLPSDIAEDIVYIFKKEKHDLYFCLKTGSMKPPGGAGQLNIRHYNKKFSTRKRKRNCSSSWQRQPIKLRRRWWHWGSQNVAPLQQWTMEGGKREVANTPAHIARLTSRKEKVDAAKTHFVLFLLKPTVSQWSSFAQSLIGSIYILQKFELQACFIHVSFVRERLVFEL